MKRGAWLGTIALVLLAPAQTVLAAGASLFLTPEYGVYSIGQQFTVSVYADTGAAAISAAEAQLSFDPSALSVVGISTENSILTSWSTTPAFSDMNGTVDLSGWTSGPYTGSNGLLVTLTFQALRNVTTSVQLTSGTILAAAGKEANIITSMRSAAFSIRPADIVPDLQAGSSSDASAQDVVPPPPSAPVLSGYQKSITVGSDIVITGTAAPDSRILVWLQYNDDPPVNSVVISGPDGVFSFVSAPSEQGTYAVWAQTEDAYGQKSDLSGKALMTASPEGLAAAAILSSGPASELLSLLLVLCAVSFAAGYIYHRYRSRARSSEA